MIANLSAKDWLVRQASAAALGAIGDKAAVVPLLPLLDDGDAGVRTAACDALGELRRDDTPADAEGSVIMVVATDAPVGPSRPSAR